LQQIFIFYLFLLFGTINLAHVWNVFAVMIFAVSGLGKEDLRLFLNKKVAIDKVL
jgi:hypothetical protein